MFDKRVVVVVARSGCAPFRKAEGKADRTLAPWRDPLPQERGGGGGGGPSQGARPVTGAVRPVGTPLALVQCASTTHRWAELVSACSAAAPWTC